MCGGGRSEGTPAGSGPKSVTRVARTQGLSVLQVAPASAPLLCTNTVAHQGVLASPPVGRIAVSPALPAFSLHLRAPHASSCLCSSAFERALKALRGSRFQVPPRCSVCVCVWVHARKWPDLGTDAVVSRHVGGPGPFRRRSCGAFETPVSLPGHRAGKTSRHRVGHVCQLAATRRDGASEPRAHCDSFRMGMWIAE